MFTQFCVLIGVCLPLQNSYVPCLAMDFLSKKVMELELFWVALALTATTTQMSLYFISSLCQLPCITASCLQACQNQELG